MSAKKLKLPALSGVGVVVKDIDKAIEYYSKTFGGVTDILHRYALTIGIGQGT